jgi:hypothetical protein
MSSYIHYYLINDRDVKAESRVSIASVTARFQPTGGGVQVYNVLYLPSLQNVVSTSFKDASLESTYQRYSHWQRQKSLIVVNAIDVVLKIITAVLVVTHQLGNSPGTHVKCPTSSECYYNNSSGSNQSQVEDEFPTITVISASGLILLNLVIFSLTVCWKSFARNYLHLAALATWLLMNFQGKKVENLIQKNFSRQFIAQIKTKVRC